MTDTSNPRIRVIADGITAEMIAEQTHLFYDPTTGGGYVSFQAREHLIVGNDVQAPLGDFDILQVQLPDVATLKFGAGLVDPVTGQDLSNISGAGQTLLMKAAYDQLFAARAASAATAAETAPEN